MAKSPYAALLKMAKRAHLVGANYKLATLTSGQKANLTRLYNRFADVMSNPEKYHIRKVSKKTQKRLKSAEYKIQNDHLILKKSSINETLKIRSRRNYVIIKTTRTSKKATESTTTKINDDPLAIFRDIEKFARRMQSIGVDPNGLDESSPYMAITARIGPHAHFNQLFDSAENLKSYLSKFDEELLRAMTLVEIDWASDEEE